ncbi:MAG TPA: phosphonate ABC transporter ATP-binding protein [Rhodospirillales bacterium]|nr:phosphonate ABC transporter ATP-binding protein [Rhodospirillales bacterium]
MKAISAKQLTKTFGKGKLALKGVSLELDKGEMVALIGASGSGKSTLLRHLAGLLAADKGQGRVDVFGAPIQENGKIAKGVRGRRSEIGVVFQQFNLVNRLSVMTNVLTGVLGKAPALRTWFGIFTKAEKRRAMEALDRVGIADHATQRASNLSGGQQQRAAIARTIVQGAQLILADEPIASLDPASSRKVMDNLAQINRDSGVTVLVSLHQVDYALKYCPRTIAMRNGEIVFDGQSELLTPAFLQELYGSDSIELLKPNKQDENPPQDIVPEGAVAAVTGEAALSFAAG